MASPALPETLKSVTATKIVELRKQRSLFESSKSKIIAASTKHGRHLSGTQALLEGTCRLEGVRMVADSSSDEELDYSTSSKAPKLRNQQQFLDQAKTDPNFPRGVVEMIRQDLTRDLELKSVQHEHAQFFSELVTEWISNPDQAKPTTNAGNGSSDVEASSFEDVGRKESIEQRSEWESLVFTKADIDPKAVNAYLEKIFKSTKPVTAAYENLRRATASHCSALRFSGDLLDPASLKVAIGGVLATDLLSEEKRAILKTFASNKEVLKEVADVLNMRFVSLETWEWSTVNSAIFLEQRRQLNGKYRVYMDEDVLDAILVHVLGMKWATFFKGELVKFYNSFAWQRETRTIPTSDRERREWYLGKYEDAAVSSVQNERRAAYAKDYFMTQLPNDEAEGARGYGDSDDENSLPSDRKDPLETKHSLLHLVMTEALVAKHLRPESPHAVIRSDFKWFGPSLPHPTILAVLAFFGVDDFWLNFFRKFLESPLRFLQDGPQGQVQVRVRGVPMSHALSDVLSEVVLFVMDFAVNTATKNNLYRLHDDFWFWGPVDVCRRGWHQMSVFASVMGLEFNEEKTGSVVFELDDNSDAETDSGDSVTTNYDGLPKGDIRWGFLRLDATQACFAIDQAKVDEHIKELQLQLSYCRSIFSYVQAHNAYLARFLSNNFGKPSYAFGRAHVDMMIGTFVRIQNSMYPQGSVTDYLEELAEARFKVKDIPNGFWYWPVQMGGLELRNPLVPLFGMRESLRRSPEKMLQKALELDEAAYLRAKETYERKNTGSGLGKYNSAFKRKIEGSDGEFMSKEEFLKYREEWSPNLSNIYGKLLSIPPEKAVQETPEISTWLATSSNTSRSRQINQNFHTMDPYWKWIVAIHGAEIVDKYGSVQIVDAGKVPLGVVSVMKAGKIRWKG